VLVSGFVALTLTPMLCSKLLRHNPKPNFFDRGMEAPCWWPDQGLHAALRWVLRAALGGGAGDAGVGAAAGGCSAPPRANWRRWKTAA
jgi:multidrug efflux pump